MTIKGNAKEIKLQLELLIKIYNNTMIINL